MAKPKLLEIISEMREEGMSDEEIIANLKQLGLTDAQIKEIMKIADQDVYSKFKREMADFVRKQIGKNKDMINKITEAQISKRLDKIKSDLMKEFEAESGKLATVVNKKTDEVEALGKRIREENLALQKEVKAVRADVDLLLAGPTKMRLMLSAFFMLVGVLVVIYSIVAVTPSVLSLNFSSPVDGAILLASGAMYVIFGIIALLVGLHLYGRPT